MDSLCSAIAAIVVIVVFLLVIFNALFNGGLL